MNRNITLKAFTLSAFKIKEADRLLHLLTKEHGLITAYAGGAARPKSRLVACSTPFTLNEFELYTHKGRYSVKNADVIYAFAGIREDFDKLSEASRLAQVFEDATRFESGDTDLFELFGYALYALADRDWPQLHAALASLRLLAAIGLAPFIGRCVTCQAALTAPYAFSFQASGTLCKTHRRDIYDLMPLNENLAALLRHAVSAPLPRLFTVQVPHGLGIDMIEWTWHYLEYQLEKAYPGLLMPEALDISTKGNDTVEI